MNGDHVISSSVLEVVNEMVEVRLLARLGMTGVVSSYPQIPCIAFMVVFLFGVFFMKNTQEKMKQERYGVLRSLISIILIVWSVISFADVSEFLYFNF